MRLSSPIIFVNYFRLKYEVIKKKNLPKSINMMFIKKIQALRCHQPFNKNNHVVNQSCSMLGFVFESLSVLAGMLLVPESLIHLYPFIIKSPTNLVGRKITANKFTGLELFFSSWMVKKIKFKIGSLADRPQKG